MSDCSWTDGKPAFTEGLNGLFDVEVERMESKDDVVVTDAVDHLSHFSDRVVDFTLVHSDLNW